MIVLFPLTEQDVLAEQSIIGRKCARLGADGMIVCIDAAAL